MGDLSGQHIKGYELLDLIGKGGFGAVYRAYQPIVGREVAIKIILPRYANQPDFIRRFEVEAQLVARLEHIHIVPLYDYWREPDGAYLVMRYLHGGSVRATLAHGPWDIGAVTRLLEQISAALTVAHRHNVVHRDLKPDNILLDEDGNAYLADFGIAKVLDPSTDVSQTGGVVGSPAYLSPEQLKEEPITAQADIYSLGIVLYELLVGKHPFPNLTPSALISKHLNEPLPLLGKVRPDLSTVLDNVIQKATAKDPRDRYVNVLSLTLAFRDVLMLAGSVAVPDLTPVMPVELALAAIENPYKGLRAFQEADTADFFGREALTERLLARLAEEVEFGRFLAVVGPSGSGKSSVVKAGVIPALRRGALPESENWFLVEMLPGSHPLEELEIALLRVAVNRPATLMEQMQRNERGLVRAAQLILPEDGELVLFIDQFEEVFTLVDDPAEAKHFMDSIYAAITEVRTPVRVVITLRADFYDRPLMHPDFSQLMDKRTQVITPLTPDELERTIVGPAERVDVNVEPGLTTAIVAEVSEQPGALPMLQYALTELFERREDHTLTREAYNELGGVLGALAQRAEEIYDTLDADKQEASRQVFLRLVTLGEGTEDTRRRTHQTELLSIGGDVVQGVLDTFGQSRLLTFDRDPITREPTVELAHEAIIREWGQLRVWLDESRADVRMQRMLSVAASAWLEASRDVSYLLRGSRLEQFEGWSAETDVALTEDERAFLEASSAEEQSRITRQRRVRNLAFVMITIAMIVFAVLSLIAFDRERQAQDARADAEREATINQSLVLANSSQQAFEDGFTDRALALALEAIDIDNPPLEAVLAFRTIALNMGTRALLHGHHNKIRSVAFSPDAKFGLSSSCAALEDEVCTEGEIILWDLDIAQEVRRFQGHNDWVNAVAFSLDGQTALSGSSDNTLILWDVASGEIIRRFEGHSDAVNSIAVSPDGLTVLSGSSDSTLILWDIESGEIEQRITGHTGGVNAVTFSPAGGMVLSGSDDTSVRLWSIETGEEIRRFEGHTGKVLAVAIALDESQVLSSSIDYTLRFWDFETSEEIDQYDAGLNLACIVIDPNGRNDLICEGIPFEVWNVEQHKKLENSLRDHIDGKSVTPSVFAVAISTDGRFALSGAEDGSLRLWNMPVSGALNTFVFEDNPFTDLDISADGRYLILAGKPDAILWDTQENRVVHSFTGSEGDAFFASIDSEGKTSLVSYTNMFTLSNTGLVLWDNETGEMIQSFDHEQQEFNWRAVELSADGSRALTGSMQYTAEAVGGGDLILWDTETGNILQRFDTEKDITGITFSTDGSLVLTTSAYGANATLWDAESGKAIRRFEWDLPFFDVVFGPEEQTVLAATGNGEMLLWDINTGSIIRRFTSYDKWIWSLDISADGRYAISGGEGGTVVLWDIETGEELRRFYGPPLMTLGVAFSPDGQTAYSVHGSYSSNKDVAGTLTEWQVTAFSLEELTEWVYDNRYVRELTCEERAEYRVTPLCDD